MISYKKSLQILKKGRIEFKSEIILSKNSVNRISTNNSLLLNKDKSVI